jgi:hypothetical protein
MCGTLLTQANPKIYLHLFVTFYGILSFYTGVKVSLLFQILVMMFEYSSHLSNRDLNGHQGPDPRDGKDRWPDYPSQPPIKNSQYSSCSLIGFAVTIISKCTVRMVA